MRVRPTCAFALFLVACGGGAPPKKVVSVPGPPPVAVAPAHKALSPARWHLLPGTSTEVQAAPLDLGASRKLYLTTTGERWMSNHDALVAAPTLAPGPLAGALQDPGGFTFLTTRGRVFRAAQPLGELTLVGSLPVAPGVQSVASAGKAALLVLAGGVLHRSIDRGSSWSKVALPAGAFHLASVALGPAGEGILVAHPQRVFVTSDDGATWSPLSTPGVGASQAVTDTNGHVFLRGSQDSAVLAKGQLTAGSHPTNSLPSTKAAVNFSWGTRWAIDDERVAVLTQQGKDHELRVGPLSALGPPVPVDLGDCQQPQLALHAGRVVIACDVNGSGKGLTTTRILVSDDRGKSFREEATLPSGSPESGQELVAGPRGFLFVNRRCSYAKSQRECVPARVRPAGFDSFVPLTHAGLPIGGSLVKNGLSMDGTIEQIVLSKAGDRYYVLVSDYTSQAVYSGGIEESELALRASIDGPSYGNRPMALAVDDGGHIVLARRRTDGWLVRRVREDGTDASTSWVPIGFEQLVLHGSRGLGVTADGQAFETADAGYHFREVAAPTRVAHDLPFLCGPLGCVVGHRIREGWDEAATGGVLVTASPAAEVSQPSSNPYQHRRPPGAKSVYGTPFRCSLAGPKLALGRVPFVGYANNAKWTSFLMEGKDAFAFPTAKDDGSIGVKLLARNKKEFAAREVALLGPEPTDDKGTVLTRTEAQQGGVVAVRYQTTKSAGSGKTSDPVDVELAWWTAHDDKVHRAKVADHPPFRLPTRWQNESTTWLDKDGLWFRGGHDGTAPLLFLRGGTAKAEEIPWPKTSDYAPGGYGVVRTGTRIVLFSRSEQNADAARIWVKDGDAPWVKHVWTLAPVQVYDSARPWVPSRQPTLQNFPFTGGAAYLSTFYDGLVGHAYLTPITTNTDPATTGPSAVLALPPATTLSDALPRCDESTRGAPRAPLGWAVGTRHPVSVEGASENSQEFTAGTAETLLRFPTGGPPCGRALGFSRWSSEAGVISLDDLQFGLFLRVDTNRDQSATVRGQRLVCSVDKGGKLPTSLEEEDGFWQ